MQNRFTSGSVVDPHTHYLDADPDLTYHPDADPEADSEFYSMWIQVTKIMRIHPDPDPQH